MQKYNGKLLEKARCTLEKRRSANESLQQRRRREIYSKIPGFSEIDAELKQQSARISVLIMRGESLDSLRDANLALQEKRKALLVSGGYPDDYLDDIYTCQECHDTGNINGKICSCLQRLYKEEITKSLSTLLKNDDQCFENFDLNLYPDRDREQMQSVLGGCLEFVAYFPDVENILFQGGTGLGKTFLSACIAREVAAKGYSVCYDSAISAFDTFSKAEYTSDEAALERMREMLECDLLILDDLGTEAMKPFINSALYSMINTRMLKSKPMIISTNLTQDQWEHRYNESISSRLESGFMEFDFLGEDIRKKLSR